MNRASVAGVLFFLGSIASGAAEAPYERRLLVQFREGSALAQELQRGDAGTPARGIQALPGVLRSRALHRQAPRARSLGSEGLRRTALLEAASPEAAKLLLAQLRERPDVEWAELDGLARAADVLPNDPSFAEQWGLHNTGQDGGTPDVDLDAPAAWSSTTGSGSVLIAILDTGLDLQSSEFRGRVVVAPHSNLVNPAEPNNPADDAGHGTHVASIAAAAGNDGLGMAGLCWNCRLLPVKVLDASGTGAFSDIAEGISLASAHGARVINLSLGSGTYSQSIQDAIDAATASGAVVVAAAGNNGTETLFYPAANENVLAVGAIDRKGARASFSNFGAWVDLGAPGVDILGALPEGAYASWQGTSMAAPHVSGLVGLLASKNPTWNAHLLAEHVRRTARALPGLELGEGLPRASSALGTAPLSLASFLSSSITDNGDGDGAIDLGETITLRLSLHADEADLPALTGTLSTAKPGVSISDASGAWPAIASGTSAQNSSNSFTLSVAAPAARGEDIPFTLSLSGSGGYSEQLQFSLPIDSGVELPTNIFCSDTTLGPDVYVVRQDLLVCEGSTLTLAPGTTLKFVKNAQNPVDLLVEGRLRAIGEPNLPIRFTAAEPNAPAGSWGLIHFRDTSADSSGWTSQDSSVGAGAQSTAMGDLDQDGDADLVVANTAGTTISVLWNQGDGSWTRQDVSINAQPQEVAIGDVDSNGYNDILVSSPSGPITDAIDSSGVLTVLLRDANGWTTRTLPIPRSTYALAVGDVAADSRPEIVLSSNQSPTSALSVYSYEPNDPNAWTQTTIPLPQAARRIAIGAVNGDSMPDIATQNEDGSASVLLRGESGWTRTDIPLDADLTPQGIALGDLDGDGDADLALALGRPSGVASGLTLLLQQDGAWTPALLPGYNMDNVAVGDLDHDQRLDIVATQDGHPRVYLRKGSDWTSVDFPYIPSATGLAVGDVDGDGDTDAAITFATSSLTRLFHWQTPAEGSVVEHATIEGGSGVQMTSANPFFSDLTLQNSTNGFFDPSLASNPHLLRVSIESSGASLEGGLQSVLEQGSIVGGSVAGGEFLDSSLSGCLDVSANVLHSVAIWGCGKVTAPQLERVSLAGSKGLAQAKSITGSIIVGNTGDGVSGASAIVDSTFAGNTGHGLVLTGPSSASGSVIDNGTGAGGRYSVQATVGPNKEVYAFAGNYWGEATTSAMDANLPNQNIGALYDRFDDVNLARIDYGVGGGWLRAAPAAAPRYLQSVELDPPSPVSAQLVHFTLHFSGSMDTSAVPRVSFGRSAPYTDAVLTDLAWSDARTLTGQYTVRTNTPDGTHFILVEGARDAREPGACPLGDCTLPATHNFYFVIDTPVGVAQGLAIGKGIKIRSRRGASVLEPYAVVSWQALEENDLGGYSVVWGTSPGSLTNSLDAGLATSASIEGLEFGRTYSFAVRTREASGNPGPLSQVVSATMPQQPPTPVPSGGVGLGAGCFLLAACLARRRAALFPGR